MNTTKPDGPRRIITKSPLSLRALAKLSGLSPNTFFVAKRDNRWPRQARVLAAMKTALGVA